MTPATDLGEKPFPCPECALRFSTEQGMRIHRSRRHKDDDDAPTAVHEALPPSPEVTVEPQEEQTPNEVSWRERLWGGAQRAAVTPPARRPRRKRQSTEAVWQVLWSGLGVMLVQTGSDVPVGTCLQFQAPIVGPVLDDIVEGTFVDVLVQPLAQSSDKMRKLSAVLTMPILVGAIERSPQAAVMLEPLLRQAIREHLIAMVPIMKAQKKQDKAYAEAVAELGYESGESPVDAILNAIFPGDLPAPEEETE